MRPLLVGDSARIATGLLRGSDCVGPQDKRFTWSSRDSAVALVRSAGWVIGRAAGRFRASAREDSVMLTVDGFVLPIGWTLRIQPDSLTIYVGDTAYFELRALAADGTVLPPVPYSLFTAEFGVFPDSGPPPTDKWSHQQVTGRVPFIGERPGRTVLRGQLGAQEVVAPLLVLPMDSTARGLTRS